MQSFLQRIILLALLFTGHFVMGQVKFSATVSSPQISKNEFVQLTLTVENAREVQQITAPTLKNFIIISGPNQESGMTIVNGDVKQYISLNYILKPKATGSFIIGAGVAKADGKEFKSNPVTVQVNNTLSSRNPSSNNFNSPFAGINPFEDVAAEAPYRDNILKKGESAAEKINRNMFIKLDLSKTSCYVGEPIIATYKLYTRLKSESNLVKNPSFNGFSVIDLQMPDNVNYRREKVNGKEYNVYIVRRAQLYPLQSGPLELEPAEIENNVSFIKEEYANRQNELANDVLREFAEATIPAEGIESHKITLQSKPAIVNVKALPEVNTPVNFKGAVGNFSIEALPGKNNFTTDDAGKLKLIISGEGNLQLVNSPEIQWPKGFEVFEPSTSDDFIKTAVPVSGRKIVDYSFTVEKPGAYILPAIKFSYFNPAIGKYKTDSTKPISFTVTQGTGKANKTVVTEVKKESPGFLNNFFSNRRWVVSTLAVIILCGLIFWLKRDKQKEQQIAENKIKAEEKGINEKEIINAIAIEEKEWLAKAAELLDSGNNRAFYNELNYAFKGYLAKKLNLPIETINKKSIVEQLDKKNITVNTSVKLEQVMNEIELQLYAPFAQNEKMQELYDSTSAIIQMLDTYKN